MRSSIRALGLLACLSVCAPVLTGYAAGAEADGFRFGAGTHFAFNPKRGYLPDTQRPHLRDLSVDSFRDDVDDGAFKAPSAAQPLGNGLSRLSQMVHDRIATPVLILRGRNLGSNDQPRYAPRTEDERQLFAGFAASVVEATRDYDPIYEIWNEWNMQWRKRAPLNGLFGPGAENPDYAPENYVSVAQAAYRAIKAANPNATVLTGSIGEDAGWTWTRRAFQAGLAETGDGLSVHFYNHCNPTPRRTAEDLIEHAGEFRSAVEEATGRPIMPTYITEFGWPNDTGPCGIALDLAAANIAQFTLWSTTESWIRGVWVYELRDSGERPEEREDNFGLYTYDDQAKPAACAYREAIALARSLENRRFETAPDGVRWMTGRGSDGGDVWVLWTTARDTTGTVRLGTARATQARVLCAEAPLAPSASMAIGPMPLVLHMPPDASRAGVRLSAKAS